MVVRRTSDMITLSRAALAEKLAIARAAALAEFNAGLSAQVEALFKAQRVSRLSKVEAEGWTLGEAIYWGTGNKCTTNNASGPLIGTAAASAANPSSYGYVALADIVPRALLADVGPAACAGGSSPTATNVNDALTPVIDKLNELLAALRGEVP